MAYRRDGPAAQTGLAEASLESVQSCRVAETQKVSFRTRCKALANLAGISGEVYSVGSTRRDLVGFELRDLSGNLAAVTVFAML